MMAGDGMEIALDRNNKSDDYYGEVLAIINNYQKLIENPKKKIRPMMGQALIYATISVVLLVIFAALYLTDSGHGWYIYIVALFSLTLALSIVYMILIKRSISALKNNSSGKKLIIEDGYVELASDRQTARLEMSEIRHIIINKHSIAFLPKNASKNIIAVSADYSDAVISAVLDKSLIVDNSK